MLHPVGGGDRPAANEKKQTKKYQKEISEVYLVKNAAGYFENIFETEAALIHRLVVTYHDDYSVVPQKKEAKF